MRISFTAYRPLTQSRVRKILQVPFKIEREQDIINILKGHIEGAFGPSWKLHSYKQAEKRSRGN